MKILIVNKSKHGYPEYAIEASAGMDIRANIENDIVLKPLQRKLVPSGLFIELPAGYEAQIRPRSGLAVRNGITVLYSPGTIDADYRGEVCIILINLSEVDFIIKDGERICQMIITKHKKAEWIKVKKLNNTNREKGGFGHTGR